MKYLGLSILRVFLSIKSLEKLLRIMGGDELEGSCIGEGSKGRGALACP